MQSEYAGVAWVVFSVLVLSISGFINGLGYKERAALVKDSYEALNGLYQRARGNTGNTDALANEYENILSICENHADIDYQLALCDTYLSHNKKGTHLIKRGRIYF
jgi:conflict system pore-forming effector with SLATT domain